MTLLLHVADHPRADLDAIWDYIAQDNPSAADRLMAAFGKCFMLLREQPRMGQRCPELQDGMRRSPLENYVIFYSTDDHLLTILRVLHGARDLESIFHG